TRYKPAPDPFLKASERLGVGPASCLALEDSHAGVRSAAAAGMMTIMVPDLLPPTDEIHGLCTCVVGDLYDVRCLIDSQNVQEVDVRIPGSKHLVALGPETTPAK